jgi:hypothetical protein
MINRALHLTYKNNKIWTDEKKASPGIAKNLLKGIINEPKKLIKTPYIGKEEDLL